MNSSSSIQAEQDGSTLRITLNRPDQGNVFTDEMIAELGALVRDAQKTSQLVVIRGKGQDFCVGRTPAPAPADPLARRRWADDVFGCYGALRNSAIPVIAAVQGRAFAFGCAVAAVSDITLASEDATFQVPEMAHNIMPGNVLSALVDRVPRKALGYLVLTAAPIDARTAQSMGIVTAIAPKDGLDALVEATVQRILASSPAAIRAVKEYIRSAPDMPIEGAVEFARNLHAAVNSSEDVRTWPAHRSGQDRSKGR
jgi:enoyl-CoA hydratase